MGKRRPTDKAAPRQSMAPSRLKPLTALIRGSFVVSAALAAGVQAGPQGGNVVAGQVGLHAFRIHHGHQPAVAKPRDRLAELQYRSI